MSTQHTPGPWGKGDSDLQVSTISVHGKTGVRHTTVCRMVSERHGMPFGQILANQRLIAAAPDLLEALQNLLTYPLGTFQVEAAKAAVAKATGQ